jgi:excisionase family DNA binding protein
VVDSGLEKRVEWDDDVIMTSSEVAKFLKVHLGSVRRWTRTGELKGYRLGERGDWRYLRRDVLDFLFKHSQTSSN